VFGKQRSCRPQKLSLLTRLFELAIACRVNFSLSAGEHIVRRHIRPRREGEMVVELLVANEALVR